MRAVVIPRNGGPEVLEVQERPDPQVAPGEVRVAVKAAGINFADLMARSGMYPDAPKLPSVIGYEVAGEVESVGEGVTKFSVGDRVVAGTRFGGYAELVSAHEKDVLPLPDALSFEQGAAIPVNYATAYAGIVIMGGLREGDRLLIHAAAGGVGIAATQLAKARGAEIFGTASASKHEAILAQGVDHAIDYRNQDFEAEIKRITGDEGIDIAFDAIGPTSFRKDYRLLRSGGRVICYGMSEAQSGDSRNIPGLLKGLARMTTATMPWWKSLAIMNENKGVFGLNMLAWWDREGSLARAIDPLAEDLAAGKIKPVVADSFKFDRAADAHRFLHERRNIGKVVLVPLIASIGSVYREGIVDAGKEPAFLFLVAFLLSFGFIRTSAHMIRAQVSWWPGNLEVGGTHIHHMFWGILTLMISGWIAIAVDPGSPGREILAVAFGIGTGLTLDEFALWLELKDVYWSQEGRMSIDAVIVAAIIAGFGVLGFSVLADLADDLENAVLAVIAAAGLVNLILVLANCAKAKFGMGALGLFVPFVAAIGAVRLARPGSPWARLYGDEKKRRAEERFGDQGFAKV